MPLSEIIELWHTKWCKYTSSYNTNKFIDLDEACRKNAIAKMKGKHIESGFADEFEDFYYRRVVDEINEIRNRPISINDLMTVNLSMVGLFEDYKIPDRRR